MNRSQIELHCQIPEKFAQKLDIRDGIGAVQIHEKKNMVTDQKSGNNSQFVEVVAWLSGVCRRRLQEALKKVEIPAIDTS